MDLLGKPRSLTRATTRATNLLGSSSTGRFDSEMLSVVGITVSIYGGQTKQGGRERFAANEVRLGLHHSGSPSLKERRIDLYTR